MKNQQANSFNDELRESFVRIGAKPVPLIAIGLWFIGTLFLSCINILITLKIIIPIVLGLIITTFALYSLAKRLYTMATHGLPRILQYYRPPDLYPNAIGLVLEPSSLYGFHSVVSIYYKDGVYDSLIGIGYVDSITGEGLIQVVAWPNENTHSNIWERVCQNNILFLKEISVKPYVTIESVQGVPHE